MKEEKKSGLDYIAVNDFLHAFRRSLFRSKLSDNGHHLRLEPSDICQAYEPY
jgi:hypothetical protein